MQSGAVRGELHAAVGRWWQDGGPLWALGLGFLSVFVWLPSLRLVLSGLGQPGQNAWQGLLGLWPHPAFLQWAANLDDWSAGLFPNRELMIEGWIIGGGLLALIVILARLPIAAMWRQNANARLISKQINWATSAVMLVGLPITLGLAAHALAGLERTTWAIAGGLALVTLCLLQAGLQCFNPGRLRQAAPVLLGSMISVLGPALLFGLGQQLVWLGSASQLPLVQLALLMTLFSGAWAMHHIGVAVGAGFQNQRAALADIEDASRGQLAALGLEVVRLLDRHTTLTTGIAVADLADELGVYEDEANYVLAKLEAEGIALFWLDENGRPAAALARQVSELSILDVVRAFQANLAMQGALGHRGIENCLLYAAHVEQQTLGVSLIDLFRYDSQLERVQQRLMTPNSLPLIGFGEIVNESAGPLPKDRTTENAGSFGAVDFEHEFWDDVSLEALQGLEVDFDAMEDMSEFPPKRENVG